MLYGNHITELQSRQYNGKTGLNIQWVALLQKGDPSGMKS